MILNPHLNATRMSLALSCIAATISIAGPAQADAIADFYNGKTVTIAVGFGAGGGYDHLARLFARHMGKHLPGNPVVIVQNRPGGGGVKAANWLYAAAPRDGAELGVINQAAGLNQNLGYKGIKYDAAGFNWIGRMQIGYSQTIAWHGSGIRTIEDAKKREVILAATGALGTTAVVPRLMNRAIGTKFKILTGYKQIRDSWLAMERGEVAATGTSLGALKTQTPTWLPQKKVYVLVQLGLERPKESPDAPLIQELATNATDRHALTLFSTAAAVGRSIMSPPGIPADRVTALRRAYDATVKDPAFMAEARKTHTDIDRLPGEKLQAMVEELVRAPKQVIARARELGKP